MRCRRRQVRPGRAGLATDLGSGFASFLQECQFACLRLLVQHLVACSVGARAACRGEVRLRLQLCTSGTVALQGGEPPLALTRIGRLVCSCVWHPLLAVRHGTAVIAGTLRHRGRDCGACGRHAHPLRHVRGPSRWHTCRHRGMGPGSRIWRSGEIVHARAAGGVLWRLGALACGRGALPVSPRFLLPELTMFRPCHVCPAQHPAVCACAGGGVAVAVSDPLRVFAGRAGGRLPRPASAVGHPSCAVGPAARIWSPSRRHASAWALCVALGRLPRLLAV